METDVADVHLEFLRFDGLRPVLQGEFGGVFAGQVAAAEGAVAAVPLYFLDDRVEFLQHGCGGLAGEEFLQLVAVPLLRGVLLQLFVDGVVLRGEGRTFQFRSGSGGPR